MATVANSKGSTLDSTKQSILELFIGTQPGEIITADTIRKSVDSSQGFITKALQVLSVGKDAKLKAKKSGYFLIKNTETNGNKNNIEKKENSSINNVTSITRAQENRQIKKSSKSTISPKEIESAIRAIATELSQSKLIAELSLLEKLQLNEPVFRSAIEKLRELDAIKMPDFEGFADSIITPNKTIANFIDYIDESISDDERPIEEASDDFAIENIASSQELAFKQRAIISKGRSKKEIYQSAIDNSVFNLLGSNPEKMTVSGIAKSIEGNLKGVGTIGRPAIIERVSELLESGHLEIYKEGELTRDFYRLTKKSKNIEINNDFLITPKNPPKVAKISDNNSNAVSRAAQIKGVSIVNETQLELDHLGGDELNQNTIRDIDTNNPSKVLLKDDPFSRIVDLTSGLDIQALIIKELEIIKSMISSSFEPTEDQLTEFISRKLAKLLLK